MGYIARSRTARSGCNMPCGCNRIRMLVLARVVLASQNAGCTWTFSARYRLATRERAAFLHKIIHRDGRLDSRFVYYRPLVNHLVYDVSVIQSKRLDLSPVGNTLTYRCCRVHHLLFEHFALNHWLNGLVNMMMNDVRSETLAFFIGRRIYPVASFSTLLYCAGKCVVVLLYFDCCSAKARSAVSDISIRYSAS